MALGRAFLGAGSFSEAAAAFAEAAELRPLDPEPKALVAFAKVQDGAPETMKKAGFAALEALIKQYPSYARGHFYYGVALENVAADGYRKLAQFQKAEELGLNDADFLFAMGEAYRQVLTLDRLEDGDKSVRYFEAARAKGYQSLSGNDVEWTVLIDGMKDYLSKTRASLHAPTEPIRRDARRP